MLLLSVRYSETAINVNIFMRGGLSLTVHLVYSVRYISTGAVCWLTKIGQLESRVVNVIVRPVLFSAKSQNGCGKSPFQSLNHLQ